MKILKKVTDSIYGTGRVKKRFSTQNPNETVLAADASKGIMTKGNREVERGLNWAASQRAVVLFTDKRIKCGKWDIPLYSIESAQLVKINTIFGPGQVLKLETKDKENYQFGMQMNRQWTEQDVLPLTLESGSVKFSVISIVLRLILVGYLIYWLIEAFK